MHHNSFKGIYYGWIIVILSLISMAFWFGIRSSFSVFYVTLLEEFHWNRGESAGVQSTGLLAYTLLAPLVGGLIDRLGPRRVIVPGILVLVVGLVLCASIKSLSHFYVFYGIVVSCGGTCIGIIAYSAILAHWFEKKKGLAVGIAVSGMGLGTFLLVPLSQKMISLYGWRWTFLLLGGMVLLVALPLNFLFLRHKPEELGLTADGLSSQGEAGQAMQTHAKTLSQAPKDWTLREALHTRSFWALAAFPFLAVICVYVVVVHNVRFMVDKGIAPMTAAFVFAMAGGFSSVFRIFWGWLSDHIGREKTYTIGMVCICLGAGSLLLLDVTGARAFVYPFFVLFGMGWGATAPMFVATAADLFKGRIFGLIYGIVEGFIGLGAAIGSYLAGFIFDQSKSYRMAFAIAIAAALLSAVFMWVAAPRKARLPWSS